MNWLAFAVIAFTVTVALAVWSCVVYYWGFVAGMHEHKKRAAENVHYSHRP